MPSLPRVDCIDSQLVRLPSLYGLFVVCPFFSFLLFFALLLFRHLLSVPSSDLVDGFTYGLGHGASTSNRPVLRPLRESSRRKVVIYLTSGWMAFEPRKVLQSGLSSKSRYGVRTVLLDFVDLMETFKGWIVGLLWCEIFLRACLPVRSLVAAQYKPGKTSALGGGGSSTHHAYSRNSSRSPIALGPNVLA